MEGRHLLTADSKTESSFFGFFESMPAKVPGTVRLFDRQDFYSVHGDDAYYVANNVFKTRSVLKFLGKRSGDHAGLASCTLTVPAAKGFLRDALTSKQLRVEIWAPKSGGSGRRDGSWELKRQVRRVAALADRRHRLAIFRMSRTCSSLMQTS